MVETLSEILDVCWHVLEYCWHGITWLFYMEERMAILFDQLGWRNLHQIPILSAFNAALIAFEIWVFMRISRIKKLKKVKTPHFFLIISRGKPLGYQDLALLAFTPTCQKFGSFAFVTRRKRFGWKGYLALCVGGTCRLTLMVYIPMEILWALIIGMVLYRLLTWWLENNRKPTQDVSAVQKEEQI